MVDLIAESDPWRSQQTVVIVPTAAAGETLRRTLEDDLVAGVVGAGSPKVRALSPMLTREGWYQEMHARQVGISRLASPMERQIMMMAAARRVATGEASPPFRLRLGLVPAVVEFYDQLMRYRLSIEAFERHMTEELQPSLDLDRGARRLLRQTRFLAKTFRGYERRLTNDGYVDEHALRRLLVVQETSSLSRVVVTVPDHVAGPGGLWPADYDLLTRMPGLDQVDVVATEGVLGAGFHERVVELLPGIEEVQVADVGAQAPVVVTAADDSRRHFVWRDREEELLAVVRSVKASRGERAVGVVFHRPLPYLYLARHLLDQAGVPYETQAALPLATEPYAAAVDLVCAFVTSGHDHLSTIALLRSPHFEFEHDGGPVDPEAVDALDLMLSAADFTGGRADLNRLVARWDNQGESPAVDAGAIAAARVAARLADELSPLEEKSETYRSFELLGGFLRRYARSRHSSEREFDHDREDAAQTQILGSIDELARAYRWLDDTPATVDEVVSMLRRWVESQTFATSAGDGGVQLVDAQTAAYGRFDDLFIVGLVDREWSAQGGRNVFYPSSLLVPLGWPRERDVLHATRATFTDLLGLARRRVSVSTFSLENDTLVTPSTLLEEVDAVHLDTLPIDVDATLCVTTEDAMAVSVLDPSQAPEPTAAWLVVRGGDGGAGPGVRGAVGARPPKTYSVGSLEQYLDCPFKYFASRVLGLGEESAGPMLSASQRRGLFLHRVLETFFAGWRDGEHRAVTVANIDLALSRFREVAETALRTIAPTDRPVIRAWLLGSAIAPGLAERLFQLEIGRSTRLVDRLTEFRIDGEFVLTQGDRRRTVRLRGVADRVDLFSDGTLRVIDYKTNKAPDRTRALQLPIYARCVEQKLAGRDGRQWRTVEAAYMAFGEPRLHVPLARRGLDEKLIEGESRAIDAVDKIEQGDFPVRPAELFRCNFCPYPTVCRKDYVGEE